MTRINKEAGVAEGIITRMIWRVGKGQHFVKSARKEWYLQHKSKGLK